MPLNRRSRIWLLIFSGLLFLTAAAAEGGQEKDALPAKKFVSPDGRLLAIVVSNCQGNYANESRVEIRRLKGSLLRSHDFSSDDGTHGYGVDGVQCTAG